MWKTPPEGLFRRHPDASVYPDGFAVHVGVRDEVHHHERQLFARTQTLGEQDALTEVGLELVAGFALALDRRVDQAWSHGVDSNANRGKVAGDREGHPHDTSLGGGVGALSDLAIERGG